VVEPVALILRAAGGDLGGFLHVNRIEFAGADFTLRCVLATSSTVRA
jgi:hypothetical protein